jgi:hypothetical protein
MSKSRGGSKGSSKGSGKSSSGKYRSAISGRYVTKSHGQRSPRTTVKESK